MNRLSRNTRKSFRQWGQKGGKARALSISRVRRVSIASQAARARWTKKGLQPALMPSIRLREVDWKSPVYLEEVLSQGGLEEWKHLYQLASEHPFGPTAQALEKVLKGAHIYGTTPLWGGILKNLQGGEG